MLTGIKLIPKASLTSNEKGDWFEDLLRRIMESQRYKVMKRVRFTGTEIDLLCEHRDMTGRNALVECKARDRIAMQDIEGFFADIVMRKKADVGFFVSTCELTGEPAAQALELAEDSDQRFYFWGPDKLIELMLYANMICPMPPSPENWEPTKSLLVFADDRRYWVQLLTRGSVPTHFTAFPANPTDQGAAITDPPMALTNVDGLDEINELEWLQIGTSVPESRPDLDAVAEIAECESWDEYKPVGEKYFVGRSALQRELLSFVKSPLSETPHTQRRVFFIEGKSGWGKSSLLARLRSLCRRRRDRSRVFTLAVDARSANTSRFVTLAIAKLIERATGAGFLPSHFAATNIPSALDALASEEMQQLMTYLRDNNKVLVLVFDQFEDVFRKPDLFRAFHKLMLDASDRTGNLVVGFSWKSEINIPMDNPAYSLFQQATDIAQAFEVEKFSAKEVNSVIGQLAAHSGQQLPLDLKRRLRESSQGFPWLTKKLCLHCYDQLAAGVSSEELVDRDLNMQDLFDDDLSELSPEEGRALDLIAKRGYDGDPFDYAGVDEEIANEVLHALINRRLVLRTGPKYIVYWDVFRDYIVEGELPRIGESFQLRQYPQVCVDTFRTILQLGTCAIDDIRGCAQGDEAVSEGTALNRVRELRHIGAVVKEADKYRPRSGIGTMSDFRDYVQEKLTAHIVVRTLRQLQTDYVGPDEVVAALRRSFSGYEYKDGTWRTYGNYFIAWLRYAGIDLGRRLGEVTVRSPSPETYTPQMRPKKVMEVFFALRGAEEPIARPANVDKALYDLKNLGLLLYQGPHVYLTSRGARLLAMDEDAARKLIAHLAYFLPKIQASHEAMASSLDDPNCSFEDGITTILSPIGSDSYRKVTAGVLKAWANFTVAQLGPKPLSQIDIRAVGPARLFPVN